MLRKQVWYLRVWFMLTTHCIISPRIMLWKVSKNLPAHLSLFSTILPSWSELKISVANQHFRKEKEPSVLISLSSVSTAQKQASSALFDNFLLGSKPPKDFNLCTQGSWWRSTWVGLTQSANKTVLKNRILWYKTFQLEYIKNLASRCKKFLTSQTPHHMFEIMFVLWRGNSLLWASFSNCMPVLSALIEHTVMSQCLMRKIEVTSTQ